MKHFCILLLALIGSAPLFAQSSHDITVSQSSHDITVFGDVNEDGIVDIRDVNTIIRCISENSRKDTTITPEEKPFRRTVIAYLAGDNTLTTELSGDIKEMMTGSKSLPDDSRLIVFADLSDQKPYIAEIANGVRTTVLEYPEDFNSLHPDSMLSVMQWIVGRYPSREYGVILEGHGNGPIILSDTVPPAASHVVMRAYGYDNADTGNTWMNVPTLARIFSSLPHMKFIFFDACCMGNAETAYELRNTTDYLIAPVCEEPANGAPYNKVIPVMFSDTEDLAQDIISAYINGRKFSGACGMCLTAVSSSALEQLKEATKTLLCKIYSTIQKPSTKHAIYYYRGSETYMTPALFDMKSIFRIALDDGTITQSDFDAWNTALSHAVIAKSMPQNDGEKPLWIASSNINFYAFRDYFDEEHYGALSMILPDEYYDKAVNNGYPSLNVTMFSLQWCNAVFTFSDSSS